MGGGLIQWHMVAICIWRALFVTSQFDVIFIFETNILAKFVDITGIFFFTHSPYFMCLCTEHKLPALQGRISTQQCITAKISGCVLKQGRKTHSSLCQSNLQLQNAADLCLVEYEQSSVGVQLDWLAHTPACKIESC